MDINYIKLKQQIIEVLGEHDKLVGNIEDPSFTDCLIADEIIKKIVECA